MSPLFSIVIPVYNVAPYLRRCIDSLLNQDYLNWEVVCVDDGSTDGSGGILDEYSSRDKRIHVIHQNNAGVSATRNVGLNCIIGDWVLFLDADDVWSNILLSTCVKAIKFGGENLDAVIFEDFNFKNDLDLEKNMFRVFQQLIDENKFTKLDSSTKWVRRYLKCGICTVAWNRKIIKGVYFPPFIIGEDLVFRDSCYDAIAEIVEVPQRLYGYRIRTGSAMHSPWSYEKIKSALLYRRELLRILTHTKKQVDDLYCRELCVGVTFYYSYLYFQLCFSAREKLWKAWMEIIKDVLLFNRLSIIRYCLLSLVVTLNHQLAARLFLWLPYCMRKHLSEFLHP